MQLKIIISAVKNMTIKESSCMIFIDLPSLLNSECGTDGHMVNCSHSLMLSAASLIFDLQMTCLIQNVANESFQLSSPNVKNHNIFMTEYHINFIDEVRSKAS